MNRIGYIMLNSAVALYLFTNGIGSISKDRSGELVKFVEIIMGKSNFSETFLIFISISAFAAGILMIIAIFNFKIPILNKGLFFYAIGWVSFIVVVDIIYPFFNKVNLFDYFKDLAIHIIVLGTLFITIKHFNHKFVKNVE